ncbi:MAG: hypothetical protein VKO44_07065 [Cyanobacteriota bacterium]|nr:hypothetical protein [Cyanobacteriota bacterium]
MIVHGRMCATFQILVPRRPFQVSLRAPLKNSLVIEDQRRAGTQINRTAHVRQNGFESPQGNLRLSIEDANAIQIGGHRLTA